MKAVRVLIVEDDPVMSMHLEALIGDMLASEVMVSTSVAEAEAAIRMRPDFAFLDVDVTDGTTYEFAASLADANIPFAFVSASNQSDIPCRLRDMPFVAKPYDDREIEGLLGPLARQHDA